MVWIILIGGFLYLVFEFWPYLLWFLAIFVFVFIAAMIVKAVSDSHETTDIEYTVLLGRTRVMTTRARPSGFSIGSRGSVRGYWRYRDEVDHVDVDFEVHYTDGRVRKVTATEGSGKCDKLYFYIGSPKPKAVEPPKPIVIDPPKIAEAPKIVEVPKIVEAKNAEEPHKSEQKKKPENKKPKKYYIEIPFEIAPNEYGLTISYPSCQIERMNDGERMAYVRFTATYDSTVKGSRNRVIICSLVNKDGKTMDVRREKKVFDASGSQMVDLTYWNLIDDEPAKVVVGVDRYN